jgi:hypothetical protein
MTYTIPLIFLFLFLYPDNLELIISRAQSITEKISFISSAEEELVFPEVFKHTYRFLHYETSKITAGALLLLMYLSPSTGEPLSYNCNHCETTKQALSSEKGFLKGFRNEILNQRVDEARIFDSSMWIMPATLYDSDESSRVADYVEKHPNHHLQTWFKSSIQISEDSGIYNMRQVLSDYWLRKPSVEDINRLHLILNIPVFYGDLVGKTAPDSNKSLVLFNHIIEKLSKLPLHSKTELYEFITGKDGLNLPFTSITAETPIFEQWTVLSYFLQMASPVCFSIIDGGHCILAMIRFYTGHAFHAPCPYDFEGSFDWKDDLMDDIAIDNVSQTKYLTKVVLPATIEDSSERFSAMFTFNTWSLSKRLNMAGSFQNVGTHFDFFIDILKHINNLDLGKPFASKDVFDDWEIALDTARDCMEVIRESILYYLKSHPFSTMLIENMSDVEEYSKKNAKHMDLDSLFENLVSGW